MRSLAAIAAAVIVAVTARAGERCPWLNAATAGGVLGGEPSLRVTHSNTNHDDAACEFELRRGGIFSRLAIDVVTMREPRTEFATWLGKCSSSPARLKAIGNEAVACDGSDTAAQRERVVGRVRDRAFVVEVSTNEQSAQSDALRDKAVKVAEQVAGILF